MSRKNTSAPALAATPATATVEASALSAQSDGISTTLPIASTELRAAPGADEQAAASAEANQGDKPAVPAAESIGQLIGWGIGDVVALVSVHGPLHHLHNSDVFGAAPVTAEIDAFISLQLLAGKLAIVPSET